MLSERISVAGNGARTAAPGRWLLILAGLVAAVCACPPISVAITAFTGSFETWGMLSSTVLPRYLWTTVQLVLMVAVGVTILGTACAWVITNTRFWGRPVFEIALAVPLAFPAYVL
ncbi:MAG: iron ABC transporter permease, partial [Pseudomonadota bacterium]